MASDLFTINAHVVPASHIREHASATQHDVPQETALQLCANQYIPRSSSQAEGNSKKIAVTILAAPALGIPKECYEPLFCVLLSYSRSASSQFSIKSIWIADVTHEGASSVLNEEVLGSDSNWFDHARDLLHLVNTHRSDFTRPIIGLGHSRGCGQLAQLSHMHPRLLSGLIFFEALMLDGPPPGPNAAFFATNRRDIWPDRDTAEAEWSSSRAFKPWDRRALKRYMDMGFRNTPTKIYPTEHPDVSPTSVTLTTTKHQEAWAFVRPNFRPRLPEGKKHTPDDLRREKLLAPDADPEQEGVYMTLRSEVSLALQRLPDLRPPVIHIFGSKSPFSTPENIELKYSTTGTGKGGSGGIALGKVEKVVMPRTGHFAPLEKIEESAKICEDWLNRIVVTWKEEEEFMRGVAREKSEGGEQRVVSQPWKDLVGKDSLIKRPVMREQKL